MTKDETKNENCIFCKIVAGDIPSYKVYEDEHFFGFLTIQPQTPGHTLLIPKNHYADFLEMPTDEYTKLMEVGKIFGEKIKKVFSPKRVALLFAGLDVNHTHLHIYALNEKEELNPHHVHNATKEELEDAFKLLTKN
jgi:histidine triad (HIT) family protein